MTFSTSKITASLGLAIVLWILPSVGTQGMGTIGHRFDHPDRVLLDGGSRGAQAREVLQHADSAVEASLGF